MSKIIISITRYYIHPIVQRFITYRILTLLNTWNRIARSLALLNSSKFESFPRVLDRDVARASIHRWISIRAMARFCFAAPLRFGSLLSVRRFQIRWSRIFDYRTRSILESDDRVVRLLRRLRMNIPDHGHLTCTLHANYTLRIRVPAFMPINNCYAKSNVTVRVIAN